MDQVELLSRAEVEGIRASVHRLLQTIGKLDFCDQCYELILRVEDCYGSLSRYHTGGGKHVCPMPGKPATNPSPPVSKPAVEAISEALTGFYLM
jgi:hypothetical protein